MPGLKRRLGFDGDNQFSESETGTDPGHGRPTLTRVGVKRPRFSDELRDDYTDEETDEETQRLQATQYHQQQLGRVLQENKPAENGIIQSVTCTNFMCHAFVHVEIGPLINWVIGHNGSGKSAILTALTVCLGGKASATNRAGSLKAFVKEGEESCTLSVKIKNAGETGYHPDLWGDSIIVERTFNRTGTSGFKLKSSSGRTISTKRSDLEDISDFYALQLDNPISVLTQDNARQFLNNASAVEKYKFFVKGVQLEQLNQDYELLAESIAQVESTFDDKKLHVEQLKQKRDKAKSLLDLVNQQENIRARIVILGIQMAWSQVEDQERAFQQCEQDLRHVHVEIAKAKIHAEKLAEDLSEADRERVREDDKSNEIESQLRGIAQEKATAQDNYTIIKSEAVGAQKEQRKIGDELKALIRRIDKSKEQIEDEKERLSQINGGSHERGLAELERGKEEVENVRSLARKHAEALPSLHEKKERAEEASKRQEGPRYIKEQEIQTSKDRLKDLRGQGNQRRGYPQNMDRLITVISRDSAFREKPIGPLGNHIQIIEPMWSSILERSLGGSLNGFIVTSKSDQNRLTSIMKAANCSCPIFIGSHEAFDTSTHEPENNFLTALRILRIDNDMVKRQLIVNQAIEQTVLIENMKEARELLHCTRLRNVKQCFSINSAKPGAGLRFSYGMEHSLNSSFIEPFNGPPRMRQQTQDAISYEENVLARLQRELGQIEMKSHELANAIAECLNAIDRHARESKNFKIELQRAESRRDDLQEAIDRDAIEEGRLDALKANLKAHEEDKMHHEKLYGDAVIEKDKHSAALRLVHDKLNEVDVRNQTADQTLRSAKKRLNRAIDARQAVLLKNNQAWDELNELETKRLHLDRQRADMAQIVEEFTGKASNIGSRVNIDGGETTQSIDKKLTKLDEDVKRHEKRLGGDREKIARDFAIATKIYEEALLQFDTEAKLASLLKHSLVTRKERWQQFRRKISARARATFVHVLSERSFHGRLKINHKERKLEIEVQPDATQRDKEGREATSLSGGEKSYSTICLLLSLWDAVGAPIRCLDEFDVFMDGVNREITMKLLTTAARNSIGRQFILISPQAGVTDTSRDVKIIKMRDPERNQTRVVLGDNA